MWVSRNIFLTSLVLLTLIAKQVGEPAIHAAINPPAETSVLIISLTTTVLLCCFLSRSTIMQYPAPAYAAASASASAPVATSTVKIVVIVVVVAVVAVSVGTVALGLGLGLGLGLRKSSSDSSPDIINSTITTTTDSASTTNSTTGSATNSTVHSSVLAAPTVSCNYTDGSTCGCAATKPAFLSSRIIQGYNATANSWPWVVMLTLDSGKTLCGEFLVTYQHVVTAAHRLHGFQASSMLVFA